ncbi:Extradiol aromatic ring-opening dioxygenase [Venustampulla echinocandica]|uniref:Extradiol aromatic ring-opening dioxygenase n=1 Tax=Venustampulla echinocandica TaxID=2656787 RepID=A0A370TJJ1_9HELO|nr:Extradiol aromatic ring-opening dioxygenase [Venustampulla echinocandica]RDL35692.1 Extradiol aromatic ring-opening dioxygenase [Venustampulla echinocandica]
MASRAPVVAVCHGGGPMPILNDPGHAGLIKSMRTRVPEILGLGTASAPRAIVLVTAHWDERNPTISNGKKHSLYYDYHGFPPETYKLKYDAPGSPEVAAEVYDVLQKAGMNPQTDDQRGWDHGVFVPMLLINPAANIPIIQLSVLSSASPAQHYAMGRALAPLRDTGVAIVGSGMPTLHNLRLMFSGAANDKSVQKRNKEWSDKLTQTVGLESSQERGEMLNGWRDWVGAKEAHPQGGEEHFLPLVVCAGAGGDGKAGAFGDEVMGTKQFTYYWK